MQPSLVAAIVYRVRITSIREERMESILISDAGLVEDVTDEELRSHEKRDDYVRAKSA
jgi:hypothetical protein